MGCFRVSGSSLTSASITNVHGHVVALLITPFVCFQCISRNDKIFSAGSTNVDLACTITGVNVEVYTVFLCCCLLHLSTGCNKI